MICWEIVRDELRRQRWVGVLWVVFVGVFCVHFWSRPADVIWFVFFIVAPSSVRIMPNARILLALPLRRRDLARTLNFIGVYRDVLLVSLFVLILDLSWLMFGCTFSRTLWGQAFLLSFLAVWRSVTYLSSFRQLMAEARIGRPVRSRLRLDLLSFAIWLGSFFIILHLHEIKITIAPWLALGTVGAAAWMMWRVQAVTCALLEKPQHGTEQWQRENPCMAWLTLQSGWASLVRGLLLGVGVELLAVATIGFSAVSTGHDAMQIAMAAMQKLHINKMHLIFLFIALVVGLQLSMAPHWKSMRLLRSMPWSARRQALFLLRQSSLFCLGTCGPWLATQLLLGQTCGAMNVALIGLYGFALNQFLVLLGFWLDSMGRMFSCFLLLFGALIMLALDPGLLMPQLGTREAIVSGIWLTLALTICIWLQCSIVYAVRDSSLIYRMETEA